MSAPAAAGTSPSAPMADRPCEAALPSCDGTWRSICDSPATQVHRYACVHEHVRERATCDEHAPQPHIVGCRACFEAGHGCEMRAELLEVLA